MDSMPAPSIYLDNNATTRMDPRIAERILELELEGIANPASQHGPGRRALSLLEAAKSDLLSALGAPNIGMGSAQVILTSGGTEANNLVIQGHVSEASDIVVVAATEHASILDAARQLGSRCRLLPVDRAGRCDLDALEDWLKRDATRIRLVSIMLGNNETGVIQDLQTVCRMCQTYSVPVHSDCIQAVGKIDLDMRGLGLSALTFNAHKLHGPVGIGGLVLLSGQKLTPLLLGGGQQLGLRPGTEPVIAAVAMAEAVRLSCLARDQGRYAELARQRDRLEELLADLQPLQIIGQNAPRLPHVTNVAFTGLDRQALHMALDLAGVACSTGSACSSGSSRSSHVLTAMGVDSPSLGSSLRFSLSRFTTPKEVENAASIISKVVTKLRAHL